MRISSIKNRAEELLISKDKLIRICLITGLFGLIPQFFSSLNNILFWIVNIILLTIPHGLIVSALQIVRHNEQNVKDENGWIGLTRFKELFPTYFLNALINYGIIVVFTIVIGIIFFGSFIGGIAGANEQGILTLFGSLSAMIIIWLLLVIVIVFVLQGYLFATPYLLEQYHMYGMKAIKESFVFMKGHVFEYIKLILSFLGWILLEGVLVSLASQLLSFIPVISSVLAGGIGLLFAVYTYQPKMILSLAVFFEEIAYYRYENKEGESHE